MSFVVLQRNREARTKGVIMRKLIFDDGSSEVVKGGEWRSVRKGSLMGVARVRTLSAGDAIVVEDGEKTIVENEKFYQDME